MSSRDGTDRRSPGLTMDRVIANAAQAVPHRTAVVFGDERRTFADVQRAAEATATGLQARGVDRGDRVLVLGTMSLDMVDLFAGAARAGAVFVPVDPRLGPEHHIAVGEVVRPRLIVAADGWHAPADAMARALELEWVPTTDLPTDDEPAPVEIDDDHPHVAFLTSGTTGQPKGVVLSHRVSVLRSHPGALLEPRGATVVAYPLFHMAGWTLATQAWHARGPAVLVPKADAVDLVEAVRGNAATHLNAVPAVWRRILEHLHQHGEPPLDSLRFADTGTYATPLDLLEAIAAAAPNAHVRVFYGATETGNVTMLEHHDIESHPGSCGVCSPLVDIRLGDGGELQVRTPLAFDGYLHDPAATAGAHDRDWFRTGDVAEIADDGFVSIVGRLGTVIRTGGESVNPEPVEERLRGHPGVADVAVVGLPDPTWGQVVTAVVVAAGESPPTLADLAARCSDLAPHSRPRRLETVEAIPRTAATAQVDRRALLARLAG